MHVCPSDVVHAPADRVWRLLSIPAELARWSGTKVLESPDRELRAGDRLVLGAGIGRRMNVTFHVLGAAPPQRFALDILLPLGVTNQEVIEITPLGEDTCRVTFN
jgi:uncharacterized protein YndB with AHSA1/START domain